MARITTTLMILLVLSNGAATIMAVSGLSDDLGVQLAPGISQQANSMVEEMQAGFQPDTTVAESLILVAIGVGRLFNILVSGLTALPTMLINLGGGGVVVTTIVTMLMIPAYIIGTIEMALLILGRGGQGL